MPDLGDLTDQYVIIRKSFFSPPYQDDPTWHVFHAQGGFGCNPNAMGSAVFGECVRDGENFRVERGYVVRLATDPEVEAAKAFRADVFAALAAAVVPELAEIHKTTGQFSNQSTAALLPDPVERIGYLCIQDHPEPDLLWLHVGLQRAGVRLPQGDMMERTITVSMDHTSEVQTPAYLLRLVVECLGLRDDGTVCDICEERLVELALRREHASLMTALTHIEGYTPTQERSFS